MKTLPASDKLRAAALMLGASAMVACSTSFAKALGTGPDAMHPLQITGARFGVALLALMLFCAVRRPEVSRPNLPLHGIRILVGVCGVSLMFAAVTLIPLADATAISFLNPVFAMILAALFLQEVVGPWRWLAAVIALCGAVLAGAAAFFVWQAPTAMQWGLMVGVGVSMVMAQTLYVSAVRRVDLSYVVPFSYATLIFAAGIDFAVFAVRLNTLSILGAATILGGAALLTWREALRSQAR